MLKKSIQLLVLLTFSSVQFGLAQNKTNEKAKTALKTIWLSYMAWASQSTLYASPADYIVAPNSDKIVGQNFLYPLMDAKFITIELDWAGDDIAMAKLTDVPNTSKVFLTWDGDKVQSIKIEGLSGFKYDVKYTVKGDFEMIGQELMNGNIQFVKNIEFVSDKIAQITSFENKTNSKKPWIRSVATYTYTPEETVVESYTYWTNKPNKPSNIVNRLKAVYKKEQNGTFTCIRPPYNDLVETTFNDKNAITLKKITDKTKITLTNYKYVEHKIFKEETLVTNNNVFVEKTARIYFSIPNPTGAPNYEVNEGYYKFDKQGDLIYESQKGKYRTKVNGLWSDWQSFRY
jgi:hypothetical protein